VQWFYGVDPLAEHLNQTDKSPFAAFWNNPIRYIDPDGRFPRNSDNGENISDGQRYISDWTSKGATVSEGTGTAARVDAGQGGGINILGEISNSLLVVV